MSVINKQAYGLGNPIFGVMQKPIVSQRNPTVRDKAQIGTEWVNTATNDFFFLTSVTAGDSNWATPSNGAGIFVSLEATGGDITADVGDIVATLGDVTAGAAMVAGTTITAGTGLTVTTGDIGVTAGDILAAAGNISAVNGSLLDFNTQANGSPALLELAKSRTGAIITSGDGLGNIIFEGHDGVSYQQSAEIAVQSTGTIGAGRVPSDMTFSTTPDAVSAAVIRVAIPADGGLVIEAPTTATTPPLVLPGPIFIYTGAGAPGNGLAVQVGDMYINRTAASAVTRLYIATAAGAWTNVTCAA